MTTRSAGRMSSHLRFDRVAGARLSCALMRRPVRSTRVRFLSDLVDRRRARRCGWIAIAALLLQLGAPFLHSLEIGSARHAAETRAVEAPGEASLASASIPAHDADRCPVCAALGHLHAIEGHGLRALAAFDPRPLPILADHPTPPASPFSSADARAPPVASFLAIQS